MCGDKKRALLCTRVLENTFKCERQELGNVEFKQGLVEKRHTQEDNQEIQRQGVYSMGHCVQTGRITPAPALRSFLPLFLCPLLSWINTVLLSVDSGNTQCEVERYRKPKTNASLSVFSRSLFIATTDLHLSA